MFEGIVAELVGVLDKLRCMEEQVATEIDPELLRACELSGALLDALGMLNATHQGDSTTEAFWVRWEKAVMTEDYDEEVFIRAWAELQKRAGKPCFGVGAVVETWDEWIGVVLGGERQAAAPPTAEPELKDKLADFDL